MELARQAANSVLDTLTDADFAGLVAFDGCTLTYASQMKRVTDDERARMKHWVSHLMPGTTTDYAAAFESAFSVLAGGGSTGCANSTAIIFLTDGRPDAWDASNLARVRQLNEGVDAAILTFTLGETSAVKAGGIDPAIVSQLACENYGYYQHVSNYADLDPAMAGYYKYFASTYQGCDGGLRWIEYTDSVTCARLVAGCMPVFHGDLLYGVTCMDANVIASLDDLQAQSGWAAFEAQYKAESRQCPATEPGSGASPGARPDLAALRAQYEASNAAQGITTSCAAVNTAVSPAAATTSPCVKDNPMEPFREFVCTPVVVDASPPSYPDYPPYPPSPEGTTISTTITPVIVFIFICGLGFGVPLGFWKAYKNRNGQPAAGGTAPAQPARPVPIAQPAAPVAQAVSVPMAQTFVSVAQPMLAVAQAQPVVPMGQVIQAV